MQVLFKITRQQGNSEARVETYSLDVAPSTTILECLNQIKWEQDGSLAFRKNCRNTICGSCSMRINDRAALACQQNVQAELDRFRSSMVNFNPDQLSDDQSATPVIEIAPMGNMPIIKDLVVQMDQFWQNLDQVEPYISSAGRQLPEREFLQSPEDRSKLDQTGNCVLCGACYSDCNALSTNERFVGPHALAKGYRLLADTRDQEISHRLENFNQDTKGVWGCTRCFNCNTVCPMGVAPLDQISQIKTEILQRSSSSSPNRSIRHRQVLIDLVQKGGWIDERKFGLRVVGNNFRDIPGLLSLIPLAWRLLSKGKLPTTFEASAGTSEVRSLINSVKMLKSSSALTMSSSPNAPKADSTSQMESLPEPPAFGWTAYAEQINGRFAMLGFIALLLLELITRQDFFTWVGLR